MVALNHIDVWGWRGMAFAKRKLPIVVGAEARRRRSIAAGAGVFRGLKRGRTGWSSIYGARDLRPCARPARAGRENLLRERQRNSRLSRRRAGAGAGERRRRGNRGPGAAKGSSLEKAPPCAPITYGTVGAHAVRQRARLAAGRDDPRPGRRFSGIGTARDPARQGGRAATVITTVGSATRRSEKALALGADHAINYRDERFRGRGAQADEEAGCRRGVRARGSPIPSPGSMFSMKRGGRSGDVRLDHRSLGRDQPVPCSIQRQLRLIGSASAAECAEPGANPIAEDGGRGHRHAG